RTHTDPEAAESARALNALAYAVGPDIVFAPGQFRPDTMEGRRLLSHELAHTIEQRERGERRGQCQNADAPPTTPNDTASSVFPYPEGSRVQLYALFPDHLFGYAPNNISNWVHGVDDQPLTVTEGTPDRVRLVFSKPATQRGPGAGPAIANVSITIDRVGSGQFQISVQSKAATLTFQAARSSRDARGATMLVPVASKPRQLPPAQASPAGDFAKSDAAPPPGLEQPPKSTQDKAVLDSMS